MVALTLMIGLQHVHEVVQTAQADYSCRACGYRGRIELAVAGVGIADSPLLIGAGSGAERAAASARKDADKKAKFYRRLAACPSCGHRGGAARNKALLWAGLAGAAASPIGAIAGAFAGLFAGHVLVGLVAGIVLIGAGVTRHCYRKELREADNWTIFHDAAPDA